MFVHNKAMRKVVFHVDVPLGDGTGPDAEEYRKTVKKMREIVFKMERPGLVSVGQEVDVSESVTPVNVNYMIEPAVAMSGLFKFNQRLKSRKGIVKDIVENERGYYVTVEFDEE